MGSGRVPDQNRVTEVHDFSLPLKSVIRVEGVYDPGGIIGVCSAKTSLLLSCDRGVNAGG